MIIPFHIFFNKYIPRNSVSLLYVLPLPSNNTCGNTGFSFCVVWKDTANIFSTLTTRLFSVNHVCNTFITLFNLYWRWYIFSSVTNMFVSSANNIIFDHIIFSAGSFMYNENSVLMGKPEGRILLWSPRCRWVDNIRMDLQEVECPYMDWIGLAQDRDSWRTLVSA